MDKRGGPREPIGHCVVACPRVAMNDPVLDSTLATFQSPKNQSPEGISRVLRTATWRSRSTSVPPHLVIYNLAARADTSGHVHPSCGSKSFRRAKASVGEMGTGGHVHASTGPLLPGDSVGGAGLTEPGHRTPSRHLAACCLSAGWMIVFSIAAKKIDSMPSTSGPFCKTCGATARIQAGRWW